MSSDEMQKLMSTTYLSGGSMAYVDGLYEDFLNDPNSVSEDWQNVFKNLPAIDGISVDTAHRDIRAYFLSRAEMPQSMAVVVQDDKQTHVANLINAYRAYGHHDANLDPLGMAGRYNMPSLKLDFHQLSEADFSRQFQVSGYLGQSPMSLKDIYDALRQTYCGSIGIEYMHISNEAETQWLQQRMESNRGRGQYSEAEKKQLLQDLMAADGIEKYLGTKYVGQKRFSLEGGDAFIPMMKELVRQSGAKQVKEVIIGMAHRGRLNVLINVMGKEASQLFQEFEGKVSVDRTGDVKYHMGFSSDVRTESGNTVHLALAFNPSHLEIISPVVQGSVRSRLRRRNDLSAKNSVMPVVVHGDAAFAGQGVVMETFNFSQARGYSTGGTVHIVINNQVGFTTSNPVDSRSTFYCTDVAKMVQAPIIHVNGDDPEAVLFATQLAFDYRMKFNRDVVIDLVCYRRHGHNEADEPAITQPDMYLKIRSMPVLPEIYGKALLQANIINEKNIQEWADIYREKLDRGEAVVPVFHGEFDGKLTIDWTPFLSTEWTAPANTTISSHSVKELSKKILDIPSSFNIHPVVKRLLDDRQKMATGEIDMNWGYAETMAYASLVSEGYGVRISGQDAGRGTFAHRHAVLHDAQTGEVFTPLEHISTAKNQPFAVIDSVLSEEAVLAFEYGFSASEPNSLVIWEAQFGDFANGAQVVIDQFISSGEQKWGRMCGLVMLLPHGYEGQGPEHSSARLERYMQLCAQHNIQVCTPTTPAQIFHLLRRQMIRPFRKPLIVMTPKSLLRHKLAVSPLSDLTEGQFHNVIPEIDKLDNKKVTRIVLCCGKVYYDLLQKRRDESLNQVAIIRIEQLYPFPGDALVTELEKYPNAKQVIWCQEEPQNQGVWFSSQHNMLACLKKDQTLTYAGRGFAAAPAVGSPLVHAEEQQALVKAALYE